MCPNRLLITGGLGFIGSHAATYFAQLGWEIAIVDNLSRSRQMMKDSTGKSYIHTWIQTQYPRIQIFIEDVRNLEKLREIYNNFQPTVVIHAAGQTSAVASFQDPLYDFSNNTLGVINALECARLISPMPLFLYLSTNKVYGTSVNQIQLHDYAHRYTPDNPTFSGIDEQWVINQAQRTFYGCSKLTGDLYVQEYAYSFHVPSVIFRMSCIYGPFQFAFEEQGWITHLCLRALQKKSIAIYGTGKQVRDVLYISDLMQLFQKVVEKFTQFTDFSSESYFIVPYIMNVGGGKDYTLSLLELVDLLEERYHLSPSLEFYPERVGDQKYYVSNITRAQQFFQWEPHTPPHQGIHSVMEWLQEVQDLFQ